MENYEALLKRPFSQPTKNPIVLHCQRILIQWEPQNARPCPLEPRLARRW